MLALRILSIAKYYFYERARRLGYRMVLLTAAVSAAAAALRANDLAIDGIRPTYNVDWSAISSLYYLIPLLSFFGYYLVNGGAEEEHIPGLKDILSSCGESHATILMGRFLASNVLLFLPTMLLLLPSIVLPFSSGDGCAPARWIDLVRPMLPIACQILSIVFFVSSAALMMDEARFISSTARNLFYFVLWFIVLVLVVQSPDKSWDVFGISTPLRAIAGWYERPFSFIGYTHRINPSISRPPFAFRMSHLDWQGCIFRTLLVSILVGTAMMMRRWYLRRETAASLPAMHHGHLGAIFHSIRRALFPSLRPCTCGALWWIEIGIVLRGWSALIWLPLIGVILAEAFAADKSMAYQALAYGWLLPIGVWAAIGSTGRNGAIADILRSGTNGLRRETAKLSACVVIALMAASGLLARLALEGAWLPCASLLVGGFFIGSLATLCGSAARSTKLFQALYPILWLGGPIQKNPHLDFTFSGSGFADLPCYALLIMSGLLLSYWLENRISSPWRVVETRRVTPVSHQA